MLTFFSVVWSLCFCSSACDFCWWCRWGRPSYGGKWSIWLAVPGCYSAHPLKRTWAEAFRNMLLSESIILVCDELVWSRCVGAPTITRCHLLKLVWACVSRIGPFPRGYFDWTWYAAVWTWTRCPLIVSNCSFEGTWSAAISSPKAACSEGYW